jgi:4'-phosphopantetheinyl transferase
MILPTWEIPLLSQLTLPVAAIHLWRVALTEQAAGLRLRGLLAEDERQRADRFLFERDRQRFTIARGTLRLLLSYYLQQPAANITFNYGERGKPYLAPSTSAATPSLTNSEISLTNTTAELSAAPRLHFNLSHSQDLAIYGFCRTAAIGVDVEMMRAVRDIDQIATRFFAPQEAASVQQLQGMAKQQGFFNCWTRKEAFIKAIGKGVFFGLDRFAVSLIPGENPAVLWIADDPYGPRAWEMRSFTPARSYLAALAFPTGNYQLRFYDLTSRLLELL